MTSINFRSKTALLRLNIGAVLFLSTLCFNAYGFDFGDLGNLDAVKKSLEKVQQDVTTKVQGVTQKATQAVTAQSNSSALSQDQIAKGLKEALNIATKNSADKAGKIGAYLNDARIKIPLPAELQKVESTLRKIGLSKQLDQFTSTLNSAAEKSAAQATPIFINAVSQMSITDASTILRGDQHAATQYLQQKTSSQLTQSYAPIVQEALSKTDATRYYAQLVGAYNKLPFVTPLKGDLATYTSEKAVSGLFVLMGDEEQKIRTDPKARVTELLKNVFGQK